MRHSGIVWDPGRFAVFLRWEDARTSGSLLPPTISGGVSRLAFLSLTPYSNAWGYPTNIPISRSPSAKLGESRKSQLLVSEVIEVCCLLFVLIRHGEGGGTSLHAGLERLGFFFDCWWALFGNRAAGKRQ